MYVCACGPARTQPPLLIYIYIYIYIYMISYIDVRKPLYQWFISYDAPFREMDFSFSK